MKFNELIENVTDWAIEREIDKENPLSLKCKKSLRSTEN